MPPIGIIQALRRHLAVAAAVLVTTAVGRPDEPARQPDTTSVETAGSTDKVRGITISTHGIGLEWAALSMRQPMQEIQSLGAGWVAIHPYAGIRADGSLRRRHERDGQPPAHWVKPIELAHQLGLKILIKPHLAYWGSPFSWRGQIRFESVEAWRRFWTDYTAWIVALARACRDADGFVVGTELDQTLDQETRWRELIRRVRHETRAPITYAANWSHYQEVPFWDLLDVVGIQAYFPLAKGPDPPEEVIRAAWHRRRAELQRFSRQVNRRIVFTELGYDASPLAAVRPWEPHRGPPGDTRTSLLCMRVALEMIESTPELAGAFLWKWFPPPDPVGRSYPLATPEMRQVIRSIWRPAPAPEEAVAPDQAAGS